MSDTSTRSGMLWEVERILSECENKPQILLMENVPQVHGEGNKEDFNKWQLRLEEMGYSNYWQDLIATDYGIPQTRNRCFMISILGDYNYTFPKPIPLKLKLKDLLEDVVDEKYYLSDKMLKCFIEPSESGKKFGRDKQFLRKLDNNEIAQTITTCAGNRASDNFIRENMKTKLCDDLIRDNKVKENDVIRHSYTTSRNEEWEKRSVEQNNLSPTLDTRCDCLGVCVGTYQYAKSDSFMQGKDRLQLGKETYDTLQTSPKEGVVTATNVYSESEKELFTEDGNIKRYIDSDIIDKFEEGQMATTTFPNGYGHGPRTHNNSVALNTIDKPSVKHNLRIRKLTPRECFRLMGVKDIDFNKVKKNQSNASLYHLAGDSIVVDVLKAIIKEMI